MPYVLDTSALIGAWHRKYPPDVFPSRWENLDRLGQAGLLLVPEEVLDELRRQDDELHAWVAERAEQLVIVATRAVYLSVRAILHDHPKLTMPGGARGRADPFVIAEAQARGCPVVTEERGGTLDRPRIPYVCRGLGIDSIEMLDVIKAQGWTFR